MLKNIIYILCSIIIFFAGVLTYGIFLNTRESTLEEHLSGQRISDLQDINILVSVSRLRLYVYYGDTLIKEYKAAFGKNRSKVKTNGNDFATPRGEYYICRIEKDHKYHMFFQLNYPNENNAAEAYKNNVISKEDYDKIISAINKKECLPQETPLGADIGIHGIGKFNFIFRNLPFIFNWTNGSIALSNEKY